MSATRSSRPFGPAEYAAVAYAVRRRARHTRMGALDIEDATQEAAVRAWKHGSFGNTSHVSRVGREAVADWLVSSQAWGGLTGMARVCRSEAKARQAGREVSEAPAFVPLDADIAVPDETEGTDGHVAAEADVAWLRAHLPAEQVRVLDAFLAVAGSNRGRDVVLRDLAAEMRVATATAQLAWQRFVSAARRQASLMVPLPGRHTARVRAGLFTALASHPRQIITRATLRQIVALAPRWCEAMRSPAA